MGPNPEPEEMTVAAGPSMPMVVFWPDRKHMVPFADFKDGVDYLKFLREHQKAL